MQAVHVKVDGADFDKVMAEVFTVSVGSLLDITGPASSGKTQLVMQIAKANATDQGRVVIIYTKGRFPIERLHSICSGDPSILEHILLLEAMDLASLSHLLVTVIPCMLRHMTIRVLLVDSISGILRGGEHPPTSSTLLRISSTLKNLGARGGMAVLVVTGASSGFTSAVNPQFLSSSPPFRIISDSCGLQTISCCGSPDLIKPALGLAWTQAVTSRVFLAKHNKCRYAMVLFSGTVPAGHWLEVEITDSGVSGLLTPQE